MAEDLISKTDVRFRVQAKQQERLKVVDCSISRLVAVDIANCLMTVKNYLGKR
jgi:hypothetical protein